MLTKVLHQFVDDVFWGEKDVLVIDLPPGTGDIQLSLSQMLQVTGAVVVTTPQDVAMADVKRAVKMFEMTRVPVAGIVENIRLFRCPDNGKDYPIFGTGRTEAALARKWGFPFWPPFPRYGSRAPADQGQPILVSEPGGEQAQLFRKLAEKLAHQFEQESDPNSANQFSDFFSG